MEKILLKFKTDEAYLSGNDYGYDVFVEQVMHSFALNKKIIIVFPTFVESISSSFAEGFLRYPANKYGSKSKALEYIDFSENNETIKKIFQRTLVI